MRVVLTVAGSDPIGGAGIQADLKAISSMDLHGCSVLTAATSQNTMAVQSIHPMPADVVSAQLRSVTSDASVAAVKTGMLFSRRIAEVVSQCLGELDAPLVVDPVLVAGVGDPLHSQDLVRALKERIFPLATVITPNRGEAELILGRKLEEEGEIIGALQRLGDLGPAAVLLKGGHFEGDLATDLLYCDGTVTEFSMPRLDRKVHGGGCTFSSYLACGLAMGWGLKRSVLEAKRRVHDAIALSYPVGQGILAANPGATRQKEAMRADLAMGLERAVRHLAVVGLPRHKGRMAFCHALPNPQGFDELCTTFVDLRRERWRATSARFGSRGGLPEALLTMNRADEGALAALELMLEPGEWDVPWEGELNVLSLSEGMDGGERLSSMQRSVRALGGAPDIVVEEVGALKLIVFGKDPKDVLVKLRKALG